VQGCIVRQAFWDLASLESFTAFGWALPPSPCAPCFLLQSSWDAHCTSMLQPAMQRPRARRQSPWMAAGSASATPTLTWSSWHLWVRCARLQAPSPLACKRAGSARAQCSLLGPFVGLGVAVSGSPAPSGICVLLGAYSFLQQNASCIFHRTRLLVQQSRSSALHTHFSCTAFTCTHFTCTAPCVPCVPP
jgi:hypothetical protein